MNAPEMSSHAVATILQESNFDPWEGTQYALDSVEGQPHPRIAWLITHLTHTKREYWQAVADATGTPAPPDDAGLKRLMEWEVQAARNLPEAALNVTVQRNDRTFTVAELLRLNARHTTWHAGQIAALASRVRTA